MCITKEGNVGIGTDDPEAKLHVNGAIKSGNSIVVQGGSSNRNTIYYEDDNHGLPADWNLWFRGGTENNFGDSYILFQNGLFTRDRSVAITMNESRNHNKLWISAYDEAYGNLIYTEDPDADSGQGFGIAGGSHMAPFDRFVVNSDEMFLGYCRRPGDGGPESGGDGIGNLYVRGNVGIGTTQPIGKLHVRLSGGKAVFCNGFDNAQNEVSLVLDSDTGGSVFAIESDSSDLLSFTEYADDYSSIQRQSMVIKGGSGNVGIGTMDPENKLHVTGAINLDPITEPAAPSTGFVLYVDSADGDLKAKSSTGIVTVLATD
jgi:hypothetical protein